MSVGFGFSVGDFISAIELVGTVIDALRSSGSASTEYRELVSQLLSLQTALLRVNRLDFEDAQYAEVVALRQAAALCQRTIDGFWGTVKGYQPHLGNDEAGFEGSRINLKDKTKRSWMRVKWAVCKKEDVRRFQADLVGHTESIQLLLATVQMGKSSLQEKKLEERHQSLAGRIQEGYFNCMQKLVAVTDQGKQLLEITTTILRTNVKVFQIVLQIQRLITTIPAQVERQEPVYLLDALGRTSPFHLEFVRSPEALVAVLKVNFKKHGKGAEKIERGEFAIEDTTTRRDVNLQGDWETCFHPGQRVNMSMIFERDCPDYTKRRTTCPKCHQDPGHRMQLLSDSDVTCIHCGTTFRRGFDIWIIENELNDESEKNLDITEDDVKKLLDSGEDSKKLNFQTPFGKTPQPVIGSRGVKRKPEEDELADFKRVRVFDIMRVESSAGGPRGVSSGYDTYPPFKPDPTNVSVAPYYAAQYGQPYNQQPAHPPNNFAPGPLQRTEEYMTQLQDVVRNARDVWDSIGNLKDIPGPLKVHTIIYHLSQKFQAAFQDDPLLAMIIDGLANNKDMRPVRNINSLLCKACSLGIAGSSAPQRKRFSFPQLVNHFHQVHEQGVSQDHPGHIPNWIKDMVDLPDLSDLRLTFSSSGMDEKKLKLFTEALPELFAVSPLT